MSFTFKSLISKGLLGLACVVALTALSAAMQPHPSPQASIAAVETVAVR